MWVWEGGKGRRGREGRREAGKYTGTHEHCVCVNFQELGSGNQTQAIGFAPALLLGVYVAQADLNSQCALTVGP